MTVTRGTSNSNARGSSEARRRRREWLVENYRANVNVVVYSDGSLLETSYDDGELACRCYRCGCLLTIDTVTVDRIIPGCRGGTYKRNNIRPACGLCNSSTGGATRSVKSKRKEAQCVNVCSSSSER